MALQRRKWPAERVGRPAGSRGAPQNSWFSPPNTSLTESSTKIAPDRVGQQLRARQHADVLRAPRADRDRVGHDDLLQTRRPRGSRTRRPRTPRASPRHTRCAAPSSSTVSRRRRQRPGGVDHVVDDHRRLAPHVADHVADLGDLLGRALLVEDRQLRADLRGELLVQLHPARVRRHHHEVRQRRGRRSTA